MRQLSSSRGYVMAVVLGTALSGMSQAQGGAAQAKAVQDLSRYCTTCWRNARLPTDAWPDATQDVLVRLMERVQPDSWPGLLKEESESKREFLRAIDTVKKRVQRTKKWAACPADGASDIQEQERQELAQAWDAVSQVADRALSPRQWEIIKLSRDGHSAAEISQRLQMTAQRVSDEKYKAIRKLQAELEVA